MLPRDALAEALRAAPQPAMVAFLTAGYPEPASFLDVLARTHAEAGTHG